MIDRWTRRLDRHSERINALEDTVTRLQERVNALEDESRRERGAQNILCKEIQLIKELTGIEEGDL